MKEFSLVLKQDIVKIGEQEITIKELTGKQRDTYLTRNAARMRYDQGGKPVGFRDMNGIQTDLLTLCLFDKDGIAVTEAVISSWPSSVQEELYDMARDLSGLAKGTAAEAKN